MPTGFLQAEHASGSPRPQARPDRGVYGIRLLGAGEADRLLVDAEAGWPTLSLHSVLDESEVAEEHLGEHDARLNLKTGGFVRIDRALGRAEYVVPRALSDEELIHPYLAPVAAVMSHWYGRQCFHAGAFVADGGAWAVAGDREAGKSSLLAWLAEAGSPVLSDDIVVVERSYALAGPRSIDLRAEVAAMFGNARDMGVLGARSRWRLRLGKVPNRVPLRGWVFLTWGDVVEARRLTASERLLRALAHRTLRVMPADPAAHLGLAGLPAWELSRPRDWRSTEEAVTTLLDRISVSASS